MQHVCILSFLSGCKVQYCSTPDSMCACGSFILSVPACDEDTMQCSNILVYQLAKVCVFPGLPPPMIRMERPFPDGCPGSCMFGFLDW